MKLFIIFLIFLIYFSAFVLNSIETKRPRSQSFTHFVNKVESEFPFVVAIYRENILLCPGSLIREDYVLTLASCLNNFSSKDYVVAGGGSSGNFSNGDIDENPNKQKASIYGYTVYESSSTNLCLVRLVESFNITETVQTIELSRDKEVEPSFGLAIGWTPTNSRPPGKEPILKRRKLSIESNERCASNFSYFDEETEFCGKTEEEEGPCFFDVGGPFVISNSEEGNDLNKFTLHGVHRYSKNLCASADLVETLYLKVAPFVPWIEQKFEQFPLPTTLPPPTTPAETTTTEEITTSETTSSKPVTISHLPGSSSSPPTEPTTTDVSTEESYTENNSISTRALSLLILSCIAFIVSCVLFCLVLNHHFNICGGR